MPIDGHDAAYIAGVLDMKGSMQINMNRQKQKHGKWFMPLTWLFRLLIRSWVIGLSSLAPKSANMHCRHI
jgi:hypothetical protein